MRGLLKYISAFAAALVCSAAVPARADVCIQIDDAHDTLAPDVRAAALLLVGQEFDREGLRVVQSPCEEGYTLSHVRLGDTITVTMDGPRGRRQGTAIGLDDLPHLYNQMVRSFLTGRPIGSLRVIDRTNVTKAQDEAPRRIASDRFAYARLGYGTVFGDQSYGAPAFGFGYRAEFDKVGVDVSFFNYALTSSPGSYGSTNAVAGSLLKLEGLYFTNPTSNAAPYFGGGMSWGGTDLENGSTYWHASGLQGELTAGYEIGRASSVKLFIQADAVLPFYRVTSTTYSYQRTASGAYISSFQTHDRYAPALVVSFGMGWQKGK